MKNKKDKTKANDTGATPVEDTPHLYRTQAISQPNKRQKKTRVALPDEENVEAARQWIITNKK